MPASAIRLVARIAVPAVAVAAVMPLGFASVEAGWTSQASGTTRYLYDVSCPAVTHCWGVGSGGPIVATADGGATWTAQNSGTTSDLGGVSCPTLTQCWAVGQAGLVLTTANGGLTWSQQTSGITGALHGVSCPTASQCWAVGDFGVIVSTANGGATWTAQSSGTGNVLIDVFCTAGGQCWAVGQAGTIRATTNGGVTWSGQASGTAAFLWRVTCAMAAQCWTVGDAGTIRATTNGGSTWLGQSSGTSAHLGAVTCVTATHCRIVGAGGMVLVTTNGGAIWTAQTSGTSADLGSISCPALSRCWAVGSAGTIVTFAPPSAPTITSKPSDPSSSANASFGFTGEAGARFECQLDASPWAACSSPKSYSGLAEGVHTFLVRQVDEAGNVSPAASYTWMIDLPECRDGRDNDGDGRTDYSDDPGCTDPDDDTEGPTPDDCLPPGPPVVFCLDATSELIRVNAVTPGSMSGPTHQVVGYLDVYRFVLPGGISTAVPCVVLTADTTNVNPCAAAGGSFVSRTAELVDTTVSEPTPTTVGVCRAELTFTVAGIGIQSAPALALC